MIALVRSPSDAIARENMVAYVMIGLAFMTIVVCGTIVFVKKGPPSSWQRKTGELFSKPVWTHEETKTTITRRPPVTRAQVAAAIESDYLGESTDAVWRLLHGSEGEAGDEPPPASFA